MDVATLKAAYREQIRKLGNLDAAGQALIGWDLLTTPIESWN